MARSVKKSRDGFLEAFRLDDAYLLRPDRKSGRPGLLTGFDDEGDPVLIKLWQRQAGVDDRDLQEVWHHEVRQLHRLGGYPGAAEAIAPLHQAAMDKAGFYLVLKPGQRRPLHSVLQRLSAGHWLSNPRAPANRNKLSLNLQRIASGLDTLHAQGLLHRNIDEWAILATGGDEPDFQLTGFEWSLRLMSAAAGKRTPTKSEIESAAPASFLQDWRGFGHIAARLMGISHDRLVDQSVPASGVSDHISIEEIRLLRNLIQFEPLDRLDGEVIARRIADILVVLDAEIAGRDPKLNFVVRLGTGSTLSEQIREGIDGDIDIGSVSEQLNAIKDDLSEGPLLLAIKLPNGPGFRLALQGKKLIYNVAPYTSPKGIAESTWEFAYSDRAEKQLPASINLLGNIKLQPESIELLTARDAAERFGRLRGKLTSWQEYRRQFEEKISKPTREERVHQAIAITQFLEALFAATDAYPVEIQGETGDLPDGMNLLKVKARQDQERDALSKALNIMAPAVRLAEVLRDERRSDEWILTEARTVGERQPSDRAWRYLGMTENGDGSATFSFSGQAPPSTLRNPVLIPGDFLGRDIQFRRRLKALRALADHSELLKMLVDPRRRILDSHDKIEKGEAFADLDESKQQAITKIVSTLPLFLVQGPPGVGKTRLVRDLVGNSFKEDSASRLLLTAQSNSAVDHLMEELHGALQSSGTDALIVRCRARDSAEDAGPYEIRKQSQEVLQRLAKSQLVADAPPKLQRIVEQLAGVAKPSVGTERDRPKYAKQAFEGLMVRAANVVFATTNSFELERLIDERGQFDWAIVEEAGKATGGELLSPLLLSHRRLMIGDHKQLSPFNSERIIKLLESPEAVKEALSVGEEFISRALRDPSTDEVLDELEGEAPDFPALCSLAIECVMLFEHLIEAEFELQKRKPSARPIAHRLTQQHRMHPAIARVVSNAFYDGELKSHSDTEKRFAAATCPVFSTSPTRLPDKPIVVVEMPYVQKQIGLKTAEQLPRWHNPDEIKAVLEAIRLLAPNSGEGKLPSLAILSPYSEQVRRLKQAVDEDLPAFANLTSFRPAVGPSTFCGTVDSFQGNEADIVIISLVRNNHHSGVRSSLGFLSDPRRMNVLLSRAKWRLVLVGSMDFLKEVLKSSENTATGADIGFISKLIGALEVEKTTGSAAIVPYATLIGGKPQ
ncbi:DEAD/DEAH box helicase [Phenylobacterium aquaticum]|uniref:DEAD/DEAH box helicase n=1 Tax=Phenylobacterium aquaticum TaxID=1763816 RepID=UPI001F5D8C21|nr:DEAD/DEAH box helicase [Phenylobacterium aquaticum]MCI3133131.1 AAA domain-containing protein [Phenylobacterium aquaticum]